MIVFVFSCQSINIYCLQYYILISLDPVATVHISCKLCILVRCLWRFQFVGEQIDMLIMQLNKSEKCSNYLRTHKHTYPYIQCRWVVCHLNWFERNRIVVSVGPCTMNASFVQRKKYCSIYLSVMDFWTKKKFIN